MDHLARHPLRGLFIGPSVVPIAYWLGGMAYALAVQGLRLNGAHAHLLHRFGWLRASSVMVVGARSGAIVAWCLAFTQQGSLFRVPMPLPADAGLGALAGLACWWMAQDPAVKRPASASS